jgi:hypothetical protein
MSLNLFFRRRGGFFRGVPALLLLIAAAVIANGRLSAAVIFQTGFEAAEGYSTNLDLSGQQGWTNFGSGGNGIVTGFLPGGRQQAYIGFTPPKTNGTLLFVYHPVTNTASRVQFSVTMSIQDSSNGSWDDFYWAVYNQDARQLFVLDFDNYETNIYYWLEGAANRVTTGRKYANGATNYLVLNLDFGSNRWNATFNGSLLATNQPITTAGSALNLGDIDAAWVLFDAAAPGDNFMIFDDYRIAGVDAVPPPPTLKYVGKTGGAPTLRLTGQTGFSFAIDASTNLVNWVSLKTNTVTSGSFDYTDTSAVALSRRFYRGRWVP